MDREVKSIWTRDGAVYYHLRYHLSVRVHEDERGSDGIVTEQKARR